MAKYIYYVGCCLIWFIFACTFLVVLVQVVNYFFPAMYGSAMEGCALLVGLIIAIIFAIYRADHDYSIHVYPFRGRSRADFPIIGHDSFKASANRVLDELEAKAPEHYREVLEYLPKAVYVPNLVSQVTGRPEVGGRTDGLFTLDGSGDIDPGDGGLFWANLYEDFRFVFLHEAGHCIAMYRNNDYSEEAANDYANEVLKALGYPAYLY